MGGVRRIPSWIDRVPRTASRTASFFDKALQSIAEGANRSLHFARRATGILTPSSGRADSNSSQEEAGEDENGLQLSPWVADGEQNTLESTHAGEEEEDRWEPLSELLTSTQPRQVVPSSDENILPFSEAILLDDQEDIASARDVDDQTLFSWHESIFSTLSFKTAVDDREALLTTPAGHEAACSSKLFGSGETAPVPAASESSPSADPVLEFLRNIFAEP